MVDDVLIRTLGVSMLIANANSEFDDDQFWSSMVTSKARRGVAAERLIAMHVILDGTFRIIFRLGGPSHATPNGTYERSDHHIVVGEHGLVVLSAGRTRLTLSFEARRYRVTSDWSVTFEALHYEPVEASSYPANDGPDGIVTFW